MGHSRFGGVAHDQLARAGGNLEGTLDSITTVERKVRLTFMVNFGGLEFSKMMLSRRACYKCGNIGHYAG